MQERRMKSMGQGAKTSCAAGDRIPPIEPRSCTVLVPPLCPNSPCTILCYGHSWVESAKRKTRQNRQKVDRWNPPDKISSRHYLYHVMVVACDRLADTPVLYGLMPSVWLLWVSTGTCTCGHHKNICYTVDGYCIAQIKDLWSVIYHSYCTCIWLVALPTD